MDVQIERGPETRVSGAGDRQLRSAFPNSVSSTPARSGAACCTAARWRSHDRSTVPPPGPSLLPNTKRSPEGENSGWMVSPAGEACFRSAPPSSATDHSRTCRRGWNRRPPTARRGRTAARDPSPRRRQPPEPRPVGGTDEETLLPLADVVQQQPAAVPGPVGRGTLRAGRGCRRPAARHASAVLGAGPRQRLVRFSGDPRLGREAASLLL
jgi:hypothetical protein